MITRDDVIKALEQVNDPELNLNLWFLGLIYDIEVHHDAVRIKMTFTTPFCPYGPMLVEEVKSRIMKETGAKHVDVELVFEPRWVPSEDVRAALGV